MWRFGRTVRATICASRFAIFVESGPYSENCFGKGSLCFREMTSRPAPIPFCPQDFPFRFPVSRVHAPRHPPPQKFFCTLLYTFIAHISHKTCCFFASERTIHSEFFALRSRALVFATWAPPSSALITSASPSCSHGLTSAAVTAHLSILSCALMRTYFFLNSVLSLTYLASV